MLEWKEIMFMKIIKQVLGINAHEIIYSAEQSGFEMTIDTQGIIVCNGKSTYKAPISLKEKIELQDKEIEKLKAIVAEVTDHVYKETK